MDFAAATPFRTSGSGSAASGLQATVTPPLHWWGLLLNDFACVLILVGAMLAANLAAYLYSYQIWKKLDREEKIRQK